MNTPRSTHGVFIDFCVSSKKEILSEHGGSMDLLGLSAKRLNRSSYFWSLLVSMFLFVGLGLGIDALIKSIFSVKTTDDEPTVLFLVFIIGWWVYGIYCIIRRLHDLNMSSWWIFGALIPFLNLFIGLKLLFIKGNDQKNKYGKPLEKTYVLGLGF